MIVTLQTERVPLEQVQANRWTLPAPGARDLRVGPAQLVRLDSKPDKGLVIEGAGLSRAQSV